MRRVLIASALLLGACRFGVVGFAFDAGAGDAAGSVGGDAATGPSFVPAHVGPSDVVRGAASLSDFEDVDTDALEIDGRPPPPGVIFHAESSDEWAVLSVKDFTVTSDVTVHGRRALVVVAVGRIEIDAVLHAEGHLRVPGPGGSYTGMGVGTDGKSSDDANSGAGGAGHGTQGASGGDSDANNNHEGGAGGSMYGLLDDFAGGSGGGNGAGASSGAMQCPPNLSWSAGGAGGGAIQLSAQSELRISQSGGIDASGGGGRGGCHDAPSAGGGGGSGGTVWLEAPTMSIDGTIAANGGGGGSGGRRSMMNMKDGHDGEDGALGADIAMGGASVSKASGSGGNGGADTTMPTSGQTNTNAGGGGGAVGAIRIRTRNVSPVTSSSTVLSPEPQKSVDF